MLSNPQKVPKSQNYVYVRLPSDPEKAELARGGFGRYYEYETPQGPRVIAEHSEDSNRRPHFHAGRPKEDAARRDVDFKVERYQQMGGKHHYMYGSSGHGGK